MAELLGKGILVDEKSVLSVISTCNTYVRWDQGLGTNDVLDHLADDAPSSLKDCLAYIVDRPLMALVVYTGPFVACPLVSFRT